MFDYIYESSQEDIDDVDSIYNETDLALAEFDSYVQEGVGVKILIGVGIATALGGLIALLIKLFSKKSEKGNTNKTKKALSLVDRAKKLGINHFYTHEMPTPEYFKILEVALELTDFTCDTLDELLHFLGYPSEKMPDSVKNIDAKNNEIVQRRLNISYDDYHKNLIKLIENEIEHDGGVDINTVENILKRIKEKESEFIGRAKRLHKIQDKYKKLSKTSPNNYAGHDDVFVDKINYLHDIMIAIGKMEGKLINGIETDLESAIQNANKDYDYPPSIPDSFGG